MESGKDDEGFTESREGQRDWGRGGMEKGRKRGRNGVIDMLRDDLVVGI